MLNLGNSGYYVITNEKWRFCMKVGLLLYENTCSEWLHMVYIVCHALELADTSSATIVALSSLRVNLYCDDKWMIFNHSQALFNEVPYSHKLLRGIRTLDLMIQNQKH